MPETAQIKNLIEASLKRGLLDKNHQDADASYRPQFLINHPSSGAYRKVSEAIIDELKHCKSFSFSVAFITQGGLSLLKMTLRELAQKGIRGRILTTDFNTFTDPKALRELSELSNIEVKMYCCGDIGFHTKGYLFERADHTRVILGSSNLTQNALTTNHEWNLKLASSKDGELAEFIKAEFDNLWNDTKTKPLGDVLQDYEKAWSQNRENFKNLAKVKEAALKPNSMQKEFIEKIRLLIGAGNRRALLISATGTGKTYAAAFAVQSILQNKLITPINSSDHSRLKILFLVHREQIANQACNSFKRVLGPQYSYGFYTGNERKKNCDLTFATVQTLSQPHVLKNFNPLSFDLIIIDEVHRAGADSYLKIINYFSPGFLLGMTASPDRTDGYDIYKLFDNNIAYEIRLQTALNEGLLCPFRYYGISDIQAFGEKDLEYEEFLSLHKTERVRHILEKAKYYGHCGNRVKGLVFCSTIEACKELSNEFNAQGFSTLALSGSNSQEERKKAIERLASDGAEDHLDYIFTVDIFNEGVDIPEINQVILLRPTESAIIFIQQLGRGLRKAEGKEYVVVLDFIGNYKNNYLIPVALSGDNSYNKDNMRRYVLVGSRLIPGASSVEFEEIVRKRILESIDAAKTNRKDLIKDSYRVLRHKLGRTPTLVEFDEHNAIDPLKIFALFDSYYAFLKACDEGYKGNLSKQAQNMLAYLCRKIGNAQRIEEVQLLRLILASNGHDVSQEFFKALGAKYPKVLVQSVCNVLTNNFALTEGEKKRTFDCVFLDTSSQQIKISKELQNALASDGRPFRDALEDLLDFIETRHRRDYSESYKNFNLCLGEKYTYEDVCRILNWEKNISGQNIGGYRFDELTKTFPVFVNYNKDAAAIAYEDRFHSPSLLTALSKTNRTTDSVDAERIYKRGPENEENRILLFVRKNKDDQEAKSFYFLGEMDAIEVPTPVKVKSDNGESKNAFEITYRLHTPVREDLYNYLTESGN